MVTNLRNKKPRVTVNCVAHRYAQPHERIIEFSDGNNGGLISFFRHHDGRLSVNVYRMDGNVTVEVTRRKE